MSAKGTHVSGQAPEDVTKHSWDLRPPKSIPPMSLEAILHREHLSPWSPYKESSRKESPREAVSNKKRDVRAKSPVLYPIVLGPGTRAKKSDPEAILQRKGEKVMRNRKAAHESRIRVKLERKDMAEELVNLRAKIEELQAELSFLKSKSRLNIGNGATSPSQAHSGSVGMDIIRGASVAYHGIGFNSPVTRNAQDTGFQRCSEPDLAIWQTNGPR